MMQIATRVVAWHNRHPLARRITLAQVRSIGVVVLPFGTIVPSDAPQAPGSVPTGRFAAVRARLLAPWRAWRARRRAPKPPQPDGLQAVFDEDFIGGLPPGEARDWADRHASKHRPGEDDWPCRVVPLDPHLPVALPVLDRADRSSSEPTSEPSSAQAVDSMQDDDPQGDAAGLRFALTAAIEHDGVRHRLLLDSKPRPNVLGRRAYSPLRLAALGGLVAALATGALLQPWLGRSNHAPSLAGAAPAAASAASKPGAAASSPALAASLSPAHTAALEPSAAASDAVAAAASSANSHAAEPKSALPADSASSGTTTAAAIDPSHHASTAADPASAAGHDGPAGIDESAKLAARLQSQSLRAGAHPGTQTGGHAGSQASAPQDGAPVPPAGPVYALVSRSASSQAEPLVALERMKLAAAPLAQTLPGTRVELMQSSGRWSAVWWPFHSRADASQARWAAALKGVTVDVVEF